MNRRYFILSVPTLLALATFARAADTAVTWDGSSGNWTDSTHWSLPAGEYPTADNPTGTNYAVTVNGGSINLQGSTFSLDTLAMTAGTLSNGTLVLASGGDISAPSLLSTVTLHNLSTGTLTFSTGAGSFQNDGNLTLLNVGSSVASNTGSLTIGSGSSLMDVLTNSGALYVDTGTTLTVNAFYCNGGTVAVADGGTLSIRDLYDNAVGSISGNVSFTSNASFDHDFTINGDVTLYSGSSLSAGMEIAGNVSMHALSVTGNISGNGSLSISGPLTWMFGTITLSSAITTAGGATLVGGSLVLGSHLIVPQGATATLSTWNAGNFLEPSLLSLKTGGLLENNGTLAVAAGAGGTFTIRGQAGVPGFTNTGNVEVQSGTFDLNVDDAGSTAGTFTVDAGANLQIVGQLSFSADSAVEGDGAVTFALSQYDVWHPGPTFNGKYNVGSTVIQNETVTFNTHAVTNTASLGENGVVAGTGSLTVNGAFNFAQGNFTLPCLVLNGNGITTETVLAPHTYVNGIATVTIGYAQTTFTSAISVGSTGTLSLHSDNFIVEMASTASLINNGMLSVSDVFEGYQGSSSKPVGYVENNGTLTASNLSGFGSSTMFNNNGLLIVSSGSFGDGATGTDSPASTIIVQSGALTALRPLLAGTLINHGNMLLGDTYIGPNVTFENMGTLGATYSSGRVVIAAPQQATTTGSFSVESGATLEFAANYDFSSPDGPTLLHNDGETDGLIIVDSGFTLTLPSDTAFAGTIDVYGTLVIAPPLHPADAGLSPNFTAVDEAPEPATLGLLLAGAPLLLARPRRRRGAPVP